MLDLVGLLFIVAVIGLMFWFFNRKIKSVKPISIVSYDVIRADLSVAPIFTYSPVETQGYGDGGATYGIKTESYLLGKEDEVTLVSTKWFDSKEDRDVKLAELNKWDFGETFTFRTFLWM